MNIFRFLWILISLAFSLQARSETLLVSHKGAWKDHVYPANSEAALRKALDLGFKGIEFDLLQSKSGEFVLAHDDKIKRISNCEGKISKLSYKFLKSCHINANTTLPISQTIVKKVIHARPFISLRDLSLSLLKDSRIEFIWIDFKAKGKKASEQLTEVLWEQFTKEELSRIVVNSTSQTDLKIMKERLPEVRYSLEGKWGAEPLVEIEKYTGGESLVHNMISLNAGNMIGFEPIYRVFGRKKRFWEKFEQFLPLARERGLPLITWTVNSEDKIRKLKSYQVKYILTDLLDPNL